MPRKASLGIDIGGTKTLCLLLDDDAQILGEIKFKTDPTAGCDRFTRELTGALRALRKKAVSRKLELVGVGIGCAGKIDREKVKIEKSPNILCLEGYEIGKVIDRAVGMKTIIGNDVQVGVWAEHRAGAAKGASHVLGIFFGTGVGGAAIINGKLYQGASGLGGNVGDVLAQPVGGPEAAQSHGIIDRIAGKSAIAAEAAQMAAKDWAPYLRAKVGTDIAAIGWSVLARAIQKGDHRIEEMLAARMQVVGIALSNIINFLNPELLVLGGGLVDEMPKLVLRELDRGLRQHLVREVNDALKVKRAKLGGNAVAIGGALLALQHLG